ncbi:poly ADP-ribose polymerase 3 [Wolffia australiana]
MKVHETRSHAHGMGEEEGKMTTRKHKAEAKVHETGKNKKAKPTDVETKEFSDFCKSLSGKISVEDMRKLLEVNDQEASGSAEDIVFRCEDMLFYGPLKKCPVCGHHLKFEGSHYACHGAFSEWTTCTYATRESPRKAEAVKIPAGIGSEMIVEWVKKRDPGQYPERELTPLDKPFTGMVVSLSGRLSRTHHVWREEIERHGGKVSNSIPGVKCLVVSPAERERGGSSKLVEAMERNIPVVREAWLSDSIEKQEAQALDAYDIVSDITPGGKGTPLDKMEPSEEALESISSELKMYGKRGVHKDSKLREQGGHILERDGLLFNCAFSLCDQGRRMNESVIMQLVALPGDRLCLYYKKGRVGDETRTEERVEEKDDVASALKEFAQLFEEATGNEFEPWEREKKFVKKSLKFYPIDMDDGIDVRYGGLGLRQLGSAAAHCKLPPLAANLMKVLCSQEIYRYALVEAGLDAPEFPVGIVTELHLKRCEEILLNFIEASKKMPKAEEEAKMVWLDFSNKWFTLMPSTRPFTIRNYQELADYAAAALEMVRDISTASRVIGDMTGSTLGDPLSHCYKKLGCNISPLDKDSPDYKMILNYLVKTYEPVSLGNVKYGVSVENIFAVDSRAMPSKDEMKKLPNKMLLWCGTRSSNLLRHVHKGFCPAICPLPVPGYMFGRAIVCSDAAAEAARYGFTAVDRPEGFLVLAVVSLGDETTEMSTAPKETKTLEEKKMGVKGLGRKKTDAVEHIIWNDDIRVPCGKIVPSQHKNSPLEYNEYAVYDTKMAAMRFLVAVKYEEINVEYDTAE